MIVALVAASEAIDKVGEKIDIKGIDITSFEEGTGTLNVEHVDPGEKDPRDPTKPLSFGQETVGKIIAAKKIFSKKDCENEIEEKIWADIEMPYLLVIGRLEDAAGHPLVETAARAQAAKIRDAHANGEMSIVRASIQGNTLSQTDNKLTSTLARKVSLTIGPCNATCNAYLIADPQAPEGFDKQPIPFEKLKNLEIFRGYGKKEPFDKLYKALDSGGGGGGVAPDALVGGAALAKEWLGVKSRIRTALRSYRGKADPKAVREHLKKEVPELGEEEADKLAKEFDLPKVTKSVKELFWRTQNLWIELNKGLPDRSVDFGGYWVEPGVAVLPDGLYSILYSDATHYYIVPQGMENTYTLYDLTKIPKAKEDQFFKVTSLPAISFQHLVKSEDEIPEIHEDKIPGGLADKKNPSDFDKEALKEGVRVELEHTSDPAIALEIAMDHLTEDPAYYKKLATIEKD